ncbi:MAG: sugar phosphate nucleotidyltransferase [Thermodesulfobacteriota bacterium]
MKAMILAAGFGTRLRPYSLVRPKPLFPVLDRPLVLRLIDQLHDSGFDSILVNCHHLKEQIVDLLSGRAGISLQQESIELGTGGGMRLALDFFGSEPVLVTNGDIFHTIDLAAVYADHCRSGAAATLVLHDCPRFNKVVLDENGMIGDFAGSGGRQWAFTGIQVLDPALLTILPAGVFAGIIDCYRHWIAHKTPIRGLVVRDHYWTDMGTPQDYLDLHATLLAGNLIPRQTPFYHGPGVAAPADLQQLDWLCLGAGARIGRNCRLQRVVVWDGARVPDHSRLSDAIVC